MFKHYWKPMEEAGVDGGEGGGSSGGGAQGGEGVVQATALQQAAGQQVGIPEKFLVKMEDGTIDQNASIGKWGESYAALEKRMVSGDAPPKEAKDYTVAPPDALKESWKPEEDKMFQEFRDKAFGAGMNQKQFDLVMGEYFKMAGGTQDAATQMSADECTANLKETWKTDAEYEKNTKFAVDAFMAYGGDDFDEMVKTYGNDPKIIRLMSKIGAELKEDSSFKVDTSAAARENIDSLLASEAYRNPDHAEHAKVSRQVREYYEAVNAKAQKTGAGAIL